MSFLIDEDVVQEVEVLIPTGKRSRVVNEALRRDLELIRRKSAVARVLSESHKGRNMKTSEIVECLSSDREGH